MKKKPPAKVKRSSANLNQIKPKSSKSGRLVKMTMPVQPKPSPMADPRFAQAVENYQAGLKAMQEHKFDKAKALFQKVMAGGPRELADRAAVHLSTCNQRSSRGATTFKTPEEHYDYAVSLMNLGDYVSAREHLEKILKQNPKVDYAVYGLSVLNCLTGHYEDSLKGLAEAIRLNPGNRFQARNDSDFQNLADDPRFTELIYPEPDEAPKIDGRR
ncbi:MAG: tetratricopeptide repeat protein [Terriglobales bacterium]